METVRDRIDWALAELAKAPYPWRTPVEEQLRYCSAVLAGTTAPERLAIREAYASGEYTLQQIGERFKLHYSTVSRIARQGRGV